VIERRMVPAGAREECPNGVGSTPTTLPIACKNAVIAHGEY
jgi:hypothetical protein